MIRDGGIIPEQACEVKSYKEMRVRKSRASGDGGFKQRDAAHCRRYLAAQPAGHQVGASFVAPFHNGAKLVEEAGTVK